jgi:hypothetical protein
VSSPVRFETKYFATVLKNRSGLLQLWHLVEHGEDVGGGALGTLLGARAPRRLSARHLGGLVRMSVGT